MNKKAILMASFLLVGSFSFAQKLSPSTSMMLHEARTAQKKAKAANATPQTVSAFITVKSQDAIAQIEALGAKVNFAHQRDTRHCRHAPVCHRTYF